MWSIATGHLSVLQVLLLHQIFGDEPSGLYKDPLTPPSIDPQRTEEFPDLLPGGMVTLHEDSTQGHQEETRLGQTPFITQTFIAPEGVDVPAMVDFRQLQAKYQLHVLRGSPEDLQDVLPILAANDLQEGVLQDGLLLGVLLQEEVHQHAGLPGQKIYARALSGRGCLGGTCTFLLWALGTFIRS